jgi:GNAT superfamily N-acetyltransferase
MQAATDIIRLTEFQFHEAASVMSRAFLDDPFFKYLVPDTAQLPDRLSAYMHWACRYCHAFGDSYTTAGNVSGAALWIPPGSGDLTFERLEATGFAQVAEAFGEEALWRFGAVLTDPDDVLHRRSDHWYLLGIGVDPRRQGQGIGSHLLQPALRQADTCGHYCCLETANASNVPFYRRHGFEVVVETGPSDLGPRTWQLARPPQKVNINVGRFGG